MSDCRRSKWPKGKWASKVKGMVHKGKSLTRKGRKIAERER